MTEVVSISRLISVEIEVDVLATESVVDSVAVSVVVV